jgi:Zn-dependent peptidase ImmA (M78 family)
MRYHEFIAESETNPTNEFVNKHIGWIAKELGIPQLPEIEFLDQPMTTSFGTYSPDEKKLYLVTGSRHPVDVLRTLAHELVHYKQDIEGRLYDGAGETGTDEENEANSQAGVLLRNFNQQNPEYLEQ